MIETKRMNSNKVVIGMSVYGSRVGINSDVDMNFLKNFEYKFGRYVKETPYIPKDLDAIIYVIEDSLPVPYFSHLHNKLFCVGDFIEINRKYGDIHSLVRYVIYAYNLSVLERSRAIFTFHSSAVYNPSSNTLLLFVGTVGAGKTSLLLTAISRNWQIAGNDLVAVSINEEYPTFYIGPAHSPVKSHTLKPLLEFFKKEGINFNETKVNGNNWLSTDNLDLTRFSVQKEFISNPKVVVILPHIERFTPKSELVKVENYVKIREELYEYATEKIRAESLMNYRFPVPSFDDQESMHKRVAFIENFIKMISSVYFAFGNAQGVFDEIEKEVIK